MPLIQFEVIFERVISTHARTRRRFRPVLQSVEFCLGDILRKLKI